MRSLVVGLALLLVVAGGVWLTARVRPDMPVVGPAGRALDSIAGRVTGSGGEPQGKGIGGLLARFAPGEGSAAAVPPTRVYYQDSVTMCKHSRITV